MSTITCIAGHQLSARHIEAWAQLQREDRRFDSPFFHPAYTQSIAAVRRNVEVALLEDGSELVGVFPFERQRRNVGRPVGGRLTDFHGAILRAGTSLDVRALLRACRLSAWNFDHLPADQVGFTDYHWTREESPYLDISAGFDEYIRERRAANATEVLQTLKKKGKSERQVGPVRFEFHTQDRDVLKTLINWKTEQYRLSNITSLFSFPWTVALLEHLLDLPPVQNFSPVLSAVYLGDTLAAAHFGLRSGRVLHWWFPAYDPALGKYSPGSQLLIEAARAAPGMGIERIDLGKGPESYKRSFMSGAIALAEGAVDTRMFAGSARRLWHHTRRWVRASPLRRPATVPWQLIRHVRDHLQYR